MGEDDGYLLARKLAMSDDGLLVYCCQLSPRHFLNAAAVSLLLLTGVAVALLNDRCCALGRRRS